MAAPRATLDSRAGQWNRAAWGLALLFGSLPLASRLTLGYWGFPGAGEVAAICFLLGLYWYIRSRRYRRLPDAASMLDKALGLAASGQAEEAIDVLTKTIRWTPGFWQALQHRGILYVRQGSVPQAIEDFSQAIRLAPQEAHLYQLRGDALSLLGDERAAQRDRDTALALTANRQLPANG